MQEQVTGLEPVAYSYDTQGRLNTITQGTGTNARTSTLSYDTKNQLTSVQDPLLRSVGFAYDPAGRIITQTLPDTRTIGYSYDGNGNVTWSRRFSAGTASQSHMWRFRRTASGFSPAVSIRWPRFGILPVARN